MIGDDGRILEAWLQQIAGDVLSGTTSTVASRDGQITESGTSDQYRVGRPIGKGGQAAVAEVTPLRVSFGGGERLVARVEFYPRDGREQRRRELLLFLAHLSRTQPDRYPALIRVKESFLVPVPVTQLPGHVAAPHANSAWVWVDVMERCTPLKEAIASMPNGYDPVEGIRLVTPLLRTVGLLHQDHKLIHRDIDESNALVAADGTLRLGDWGIAHPMSGDHIHTHTVPFGKWATTPPENRDGAWTIGHFTDAWQCGRLIGYTFIGASPLLNDGIEANNPRLRNLPQVIRSVIEGLCRRDAVQRLATTAAAEQLDNRAEIRTLRTSLSYASLGDPHLEIFAVDSGRIWHRWWWHGEGWSTWQPFEGLPGGVLAASVTAGNHTHEYEDLFAVGVDGRIFQTWFDGPSGRWAPWVHMEGPEAALVILPGPLDVERSADPGGG